MIEKKVNGKMLRLVRGDITDLEVDAFVYYATGNLVLGSGFGTSISMRGGPSVQKECSALAPLNVGQAGITTAGEMKAGKIIHAVGPRFQDEEEEKKLRETVQSALKVADENGIETLAFPAMGCGFYGIPVGLCAKVMIEVIKTHLSNGHTAMKEVTVCVPDGREYGPFGAEIGKV